MNHQTGFIGGIVVCATALVLLGCVKEVAKPPPDLTASASGDDELELTGKKRPRQIPNDWIGTPIPNGRGFRWTDPRNRGNAVRIFRGDPEASNPVDRHTYVIVTVDGEELNASGGRSGHFIRD